MQKKNSVDLEKQDHEKHRLMTLFATEKIEDYIVLSLVLLILIFVLATH